jgi:hypothetical protein
VTEFDSFYPKFIYVTVILLLIWFNEQPKNLHGFNFTEHKGTVAQYFSLLDLYSNQYFFMTFKNLCRSFRGYSKVFCDIPGGNPTKN